MQFSHSRGRIGAIEMSYIYKQDFGKCFDDLPLPQNEGTISHPLIELDEVYRKAEAFDEIESIHLNMFGDTVRAITKEEAENFGMSVMRVLKLGRTNK